MSWRCRRRLLPRHTLAGYRTSLVRIVRAIADEDRRGFVLFFRGGSGGRRRERMKGTMTRKQKTRSFNAQRKRGEGGGGERREETEIVRGRESETNAIVRGKLQSADCRQHHSKNPVHRHQVLRINIYFPCPLILLPKSRLCYRIPSIPHPASPIPKKKVQGTLKTSVLPKHLLPIPSLVKRISFPTPVMIRCHYTLTKNLPHAPFTAETPTNGVHLRVVHFQSTLSSLFPPKKPHTQNEVEQTETRSSTRNHCYRYSAS